MVRPSSVCYHTFSLLMSSSHGFRVYYTWLNRPIQTWFPYGSGCISALTLPHTVSRWFLLQRHASPEGSDSLKAQGFRIYFTPLRGFFSPFLSRYLFTIDLVYSLALERGRPEFTPDFTCPMLLRNIANNREDFKYRALTLFGGPSRFFLYPKYHYLNFVMKTCNPYKQRVHPA